MSGQTEAAPSLVERIKRSLVGLKMPRALEIVDATVRRVERGEVSPLEAVEALLAEELSLRESWRAGTALAMARRSTVKTRAGFGFAFQPWLDKNRGMALAELGCVDRREAVHLLGPPETGKSHRAVALGVEAVKAGRSVCFATLAGLAGALTKAEREGMLRRKTRCFCRPSPLLVTGSAARRSPPAAPACSSSW